MVRLTPHARHTHTPALQSPRNRVVSCLLRRQTRTDCFQHSRRHEPVTRARVMSARVMRRGPTGTLLNELADASFSHADCRIIFVRLSQPLLYFPLCTDSGRC